MDLDFGIAIAVQVLRISIPYVLAALGGTFSERGGVANIALEGILLVGAFSAVLGVHLTSNPWLGAGAGIVGGVGLSALFGWIVLRFKADPIVTGVAVNLLALGGTRYLLKLIWGSSSNSDRIDALAPWASADGAWGGVLSLLTHPLFLLTVLLVAAAHVALFSTRFGLRLRACGEHPEAAASVGVRVVRLRVAGVLLSGALAGLAGVWLAMESHQFTDGMSGGRGFIALAAMIFGRWRPLRAMAACLLFGAAETVQITLQGTGSGIPTQFLQMLPYVLTLATLVAAGVRNGSSRRTG